MKNLKHALVVPLAALVLAVAIIPQSSHGQATGAANALPPATPYTITAQDANSRVWERTTYAKAADGSVVARKSDYTEIQSGLNYQDPSTGQWKESKEEIDIQPGTDGASATQGQHQSYFPGDIFQGVIKEVTPDGLQLQSRPVGLFYEDDTNSVLIAILTNSVGELVSSNQIVYPNAFEGADASIRYTYRKAGFEQDVIVQGQLPDPAALGLDPARTQLGMLTVFFNTNDPVATPGPLDAANGLRDWTLTFGSMTMGPGRAFSIGDTEPSTPPAGATPAAFLGWLTNSMQQSSAKETPTFKHWFQLDGRNYLMEEVPYHRVAAQLSQLPATTLRQNVVSTKLYAANSFLDAIPARLLSPVAQVSKSKMTRLARRGGNSLHGLVLDYVTVVGNSTYTFQGDTTYYVSGPCYFGNITLEGGTVIKYANYNSATAYIEVSGTVTCNTSSYRPAIFTAVDDNTVGQSIGTGYPSGNYYADPAIYAPNGFNLSNVRISYAEQAVWVSGSGSSSTLSDSQFINCQEMLELGNGSADAITLTCNNCLFEGPYGLFAWDNGYYEGGDRFKLNNCTVDNGYYFASGTTYPYDVPYSINATNCIFANISLSMMGSGSLQGGYNGFYSAGSTFGSSPTTSGSVPFQTVGAGSFYLTNSTFRGIGTTVIGSNLLADLKTKTTWPPMLLTNQTISINTNLSPQAIRDTNSSPDLGYHYVPIDYIADLCSITNATLTLTNGVALATYNEAGIKLKDNSAIVSIGSPLYPNWFARYSSVQDQSVALGGTVNNNGIDVYPSYTSAKPNGTYQFTKFACPAGGGFHLDDYATASYGGLNVQECEFWGGTNVLGGTNGTTLLLDNNLFARSCIGAVGSGSLSFSNNLVWGTASAQLNPSSGTVWYAYNNDFDSTTIASSTLTNGYNAYLNSSGRLYPTNLYDIVSASTLAYKSSWLGIFYQPTNSLLINKGGTTADQVGLYHYTTQTNQVPETNSTVDIGYHYVATYAYGNPLDSNSNGIPDYLEDANGNGIYDSGDLSDWQNFDNDGNGLPDWWELKYFGHTGVDPYADPDGDGWNNLQEFQNGTDPTVFNTPPTPQISVTYNASDGVATVSWLPSPGPVTGYTVTDSNGTNYYVPAGTDSLTVNVPDDPFDIADYGPLQYSGFTIQSHYTGGDSALSDLAWTQPGVETANPVSAYLIPGPQGASYLAISALPVDTVSLRVTRIDQWAEYGGDSSFDTNFDIPVSAFTNGLYKLPASLEITPADSYGNDSYKWWVQAIGANDNPSAPEELTGGYYYGTNNTSWLVPPFFDGRVQLKQNLNFLFRAANAYMPFQYNNFFYPTNHAYAGLYSTDGYNTLDVFKPFEDNYLFRNFVFSSTNLDTNGVLTTGAGFDFYGGNGVILTNPPAYSFVQPTNIVSIPAILDSTNAEWTYLYPQNTAAYGDPTDLAIALSWIRVSSGGTFSLAVNQPNFFGLPFLSVKFAYNSGSSLGFATLNAGSSIPAVNGGIYPQTAQPQYQTVEYDFWNPNTDTLPGMSGFSQTNTSRLMIAPVGSSIQIAGYAKMAVTNGYSGVYGYLGQYFDKAYQITNGVMTTNTTGVLSPYGNFFATQAGPAALVTMADIDTGARGTCTVYCVSMNVDANHDGNMDLSFNGPDATSQSSPMSAWVNNGDIVPGNNGNLDRDVEDLAHVSPNFAAGQITCQRDLENFFRLWICGLPSALSNQNYYATLSCTAISGSPAINLYYAETNGGTRYLMDTNVAASLVGESKLATISPTSPFAIPFWLYNGSNLNFLFEGAGVGEGQFTLTIYQGTNAIAQTSTYIDLHDIKDFYEQAHIAGLQNTYPAMINSTNASTFVSDHELPSSLSESNQLVVFVHGWRMGIFDYQDFSDTMFKRLYWSGYHGRFASLRWPTLSKDDFWTSGDLLSYTTYNRSEYIAHRSADGASAYFDWLKSRLPNYSVNAVSHSMGGIVMMETLKLQLAENSHSIDNYVMMQAAVPAHCYDTSLADYSLFTSAENATTTSHTPDIYRGFPGNIEAAVNGQIVNFFNTNDFALATGTFLTANVSWEGNEVNFKPDGAEDYYSDGTNCFQLFSRTVTDPREQMAFVARPRSKAAGALEGVAGQVDGGELDLTSAYNFREKSNQHSAEFNWNIQQLGGTNGFYRQLGVSLGIFPIVTP